MGYPPPNTLPLHVFFSVPPQEPSWDILLVGVGLGRMEVVVNLTAQVPNANWHPSPLQCSNSPPHHDADEQHPNRINYLYIPVKESLRTSKGRSSTCFAIESAASSVRGDWARRTGLCAARCGRFNWWERRNCRTGAERGLTASSTELGCRTTPETIWVSLLVIARVKVKAYQPDDEQQSARSQYHNIGLHAFGLYILPNVLPKHVFPFTPPHCPSTEIFAPVHVPNPVWQPALQKSSVFPHLRYH